MRSCVPKTPPPAASSIQGTPAQLRYTLALDSPPELAHRPRIHVVVAAEYEITPRAAQSPLAAHFSLTPTP